MRTLILVAAGLSLVALPAHAQEPDVEYDVKIVQGSVFTTMRNRDGKNVRLVSLNFHINRLGDDKPVISIPREEVLVEEDGKKVAGLDVMQPRAQELSVVLAMDISGSMARGKKMEEARQAALTFIDKLDERSDVGLILFDHEIRVAEEPARDKALRKEHREKLKRLVQEAKPQGGTAYLDATVRAVQMLRDRKGRRACVVMTDGVDVNSKARLQEAIDQAVGYEVPVYTVGIGEPGRNDPVTTVLVLDRSGSMIFPAASGDKLRKIDALKRAATRFVELMGPGAKTTLLPFSDRIDTPEPFTSNQEELKKRIEALKAQGSTLLYDATFVGLETLAASGVKGRRAVVVLTDGRDEGDPGSRNSDDDVIERAKELKIPLYLLRLGEKGQINEPVMQKMARQTGGEYYHAGTQVKLLELFENLSIQLHDDGVDEKALGELASKTGGRY